MASQCEPRQAAPERGQRHREFTVDPYTVGASQFINPAFASAPPSSTAPSFAPPASSYGRRKNSLGYTRRNDRTELALRKDDEVFQNYRDQDDVDQEHSFDVALARPDLDVDSHAPACACDARCQCKPACKYEIHSCPCVPCGPRLRHCGNESVPPSRSFEAARRDSAQHVSRKPLDRTLPDRSFDGALSRQKSQLAKGPRRNDGAAGGDPTQLRRQRAPTVNADLAYVPPAPTKTPSRKPKDTTPLGFYGSHSGQRYPTFNVGPVLSNSDTLSAPVFAAAPTATEQAQTVESIARALRRLRGSIEDAAQTAEPSIFANGKLNSSLALFSSEDECERRAPSPLCAPRQRRYQCNKTYAAITGEDADNYDEYDEYPAPELSPGPITYPAIPRSTSADLFPLGVYTPTATQSFPSAQVGNPRDAESIAEQAHSNDEDCRDQYIRMTADGDIPIRHSSPASTVHRIPTQVSGPLPLPEFIAPRPATKQRYVSAGGNARLEDRPEITGFALPPRVAQGISIQRDVFLQHLESVPQFATPKRSMEISSPILRGSEEVMLSSSTRSSYDDGADHQGTRSNRKEGGSGQRMAKFKRVFSFGKDGKDK